MPAAFQCIEEFQLNTMRTVWSGGGNSRGQPPASNGIECPETLRGRLPGSGARTFTPLCGEK